MSASDFSDRVVRAAGSEGELFDHISRVLNADGELFHDKRMRVQVPPVPAAPLVDTHGHFFVDMKPTPEICLVRAALAGVAALIVPINPAERDGLGARASTGEQASTGARAVLDRLSRWQEAGQRLLDACIDEGIKLPVFDGETPSAHLPMNVRIVAGFHPYDAAQLQDAHALSELEVLLNDARCVGVGEFGLDFGPHSRVPADIQEQAFRTQLQFAHSRGLPVQLHIRDAQGDEATQAHRDALRILDEEGIPQAGCDLHCFTCGPEVLAPFVQRGCYIAFGGVATFSRSDDIREAAAACPQELLLSETDCPFMTPAPLRGLSCEPAMVTWNAACVARVREEVLGIPPAQTYHALWENAHRLFTLV